MSRFWKIAFFALPLGYALYYAPYGVNETDGGFLTGLAWQLLCGKTLYADVVYVRPPLPVWMRALELLLLPEQWAMLGERWIFYAKVAAYSWLGAAMLAGGSRRWMTAVFGFVVSAHCYPAAAWHTVDGILFGALGLWCWAKFNGRSSAFFSGLAMVGCLLCKQSFYPMLPCWLLLLTSEAWFVRDPAEKRRQWIRAALAGLAFGIASGAFFIYLFQQNSLGAFFSQTTGATSGGQAWQHGVLDYFRINPAVAGPGVLLLLAALWFWKKREARAALGAWVLFLLLLGGSFAWAVWGRREFTAPFAQSRLLFWAAAGYGMYYFSARRHGGWADKTSGAAMVKNLFALLALSWCASVSWGYNLPILFATPWVFAALEISRRLFRAAWPDRPSNGLAVLSLLGLLALFRWGYQFVYRDGPRNAMTEPLGAVFPSMRGLYSSPQTAARYRDLRDLCRRYGPVFKTLPAFPQSNFLTKTPPPLPLDWVVEREMGTARNAVAAAVAEGGFVFFIEKAYGERLASDPELRLTRMLLQKGRVLEETEFFRVVRL